MLRRPPTVLTLTPDDLKTYEDRREAARFQMAQARAAKQQLHQDEYEHHQQHQQQQQQIPLTELVRYDEITTASDTSSGYANPRNRFRADEDDDDDEGEEEEEEDIDEDEDSYFPRRHRTIDEPEDPGAQIYRNRVDRQQGTEDLVNHSSSSSGAMSTNTEDEVMAELALENLVQPEQVQEQEQRHQQPVSRFARGRTAAVTPTPGAAGGGRVFARAEGATTPEAPVRATRNREERIMGRGGRR